MFISQYKLGCFLPCNFRITPKFPSSMAISKSQERFRGGNIDPSLMARRSQVHESSLAVYLCLSLSVIDRITSE